MYSRPSFFSNIFYLIFYFLDRGAPCKSEMFFICNMGVLNKSLFNLSPTRMWSVKCIYANVVILNHLCWVQITTIYQIWDSPPPPHCFSVGIYIIFLKPVCIIFICCCFTFWSPPRKNGEKQVRHSHVCLYRNAVLLLCLSFFLASSDRFCFLPDVISCLVYAELAV